MDMPYLTKYEIVSSAFLFILFCRLSDNHNFLTSWTQVNPKGLIIIIVSYTNSRCRPIVLTLLLYVHLAYLSFRTEQYYAYYHQYFLKVVYC
jgi:hypothetical protein